MTAKLQAVAEGLAREPKVEGWDVTVGVVVPLPPHAVSAKSATASTARIEYFHLFFITSIFVTSILPVLKY
jgi:hypothetical protein